MNSDNESGSRDEVRGVVAVHCKAGDGTLMSVYLMLRHGFTAREAMGWLRIMRPRSVIAEQQHYLCSLEAEEEHHAQTPRLGPASSDGIAGGAPSALLAAQVAAGMERRGEARAQLEGLRRACCVAAESAAPTAHRRRTADAHGD